MVFKQGLERFEDLDFAGDPRGRLRLALDHGHAERALVSGHQALQMLEQELRTEREECDPLNAPTRETREKTTPPHPLFPADISDVYFHELSRIVRSVFASEPACLTNLIKVWMLIAHQKIQGDNKVRE